MVIHGYCLMGNHYHLLLQTPHGNLGRVMRHLNGVYTQRYNRLKPTDGPLFRGCRYDGFVGLISLNPNGVRCSNETGPRLVAS